MNEKLIKETVEMCWRIVCKADLPGLPAMMLGIKDQMGMECVCAYRLQIFNSLVANLLPKGEQPVKHSQERIKDIYEE